MNSRWLVLLNILAAILLAASYYISLIPPDEFWPASFPGFVFPYLLLINFAFILIWIFTKRIFALISILAIILSIEGTLVSISIPFKQQEGQLSIMSYNVKNFDLYNWSRNDESRLKMLEIIKNENPDIICFQEFFTHEKEELDNIKKLHMEFGYKHFHYEESSNYLKNHWGAATFSKYPIVNKGRIIFDKEKGNVNIFTDIKIDGKLFRVYNLHLQSYHMVEEDYEFLKSVSDFEVPEKGSLFTIAKKLKMGFRKRSVQADIIKDHINSFEGYKIVCGDFNDVPISYSYKTISSGLKDSYRLRAPGMGKTFVSSLPSLRIDYILLDKNLTVDEYQRLPYKYSDHYPITVSFSFD